MFLYQMLRGCAAHIEFLVIGGMNMTDGIGRREKLDLLEWFEQRIASEGFVFGLRELYPKQIEKLLSWGFQVTVIGDTTSKNKAHKLCGVSALGSPEGSAAYYMLEVASKENQKLKYALNHRPSGFAKLNRPYEDVEVGGWHQ